MAEEGGSSSGAQGPGAPGAGSQAGQDGQSPGGSQQGPGGSAQQQSQQQTDTRIAELTKQIEDLRKEAAANRAKAKEAEDSKLTETEKLQKQVTELNEKVQTAERERRQRAVADTVASAAKKAGALYPETLHKLLDLDLGEDGMPTNLETAITKAKKDYPALFGASGSADGGAGRGKEPKSGWLRDALNRQR